MQIGGFTQALTGVGYPTMLGMYLFTVGTKMTVRTAPRMLVRGLGIMAAKVGTATIFALVVAHMFSGNVFGLSTLAVMVAMSDTNGGMFLALMSVMGNKDDAGTYVVQSIETGPFLTMLIFVGAGLAVIPWLTMVSVIAPIVVGAILGNLDEDLTTFFGSHEPIIVPFMAFTLGQTINLRSVVTAGLPGIVLGVTVTDRRLIVWPSVKAMKGMMIGSWEPKNVFRSSSRFPRIAPTTIGAITDTIVSHGITARPAPTKISIVRNGPVSML